MGQPQPQPPVTESAGSAGGMELVLVLMHDLPCPPGAHDVDEHFQTAPFEDNIPVLLTSVFSPARQARTTWTSTSGRRPSRTTSPCCWA